MEVATSFKTLSGTPALLAIVALARGVALRHLSRGTRRRFLLALGLLLVEAAASIASLYLLAYLIDYLTGARPGLLSGLGLLARFSPRAPTLLVLAAALALNALLRVLAATGAEHYLASGGRQLGFDLRAALRSQLQRLSLAFYSQQRAGELLGQAADDIAAIEGFVIASLRTIGGSIALIALSLAALLLSAWQIALIALGTILVMSLVASYFAARIGFATGLLRALDAQVAASTHALLTATGNEQAQGEGGHQHFAEQSQQSRSAALAASALRPWASGALYALQTLLLVLVALIGVWLVDGGALSVGGLALCLALCAGLFKPIQRTASEWRAMGQLAEGLERIGEVLDREPTTADQPGAAPAPALRGAIAFRNVSFAYHAHEADGTGANDGGPQLALRDVSFEVAPGEALALVGDGGAGASTIAQLLARLYDPHRGQVLIDGRDIRTFTLASLRAQIVRVTQDAPPFSGSVADCIAQGCGTATREAIIAAAMQANAHAFIEQLPNGYDTPLGVLASTLSTGQRQQLVIAHAFLHNAPLLILNEPISGLDAEAAELVLLALRSLMRRKTTLIVSREPDLIRYADRIVVIAHGAVAQIGNHKALLRARGPYAALYASQLRRRQAEQTAARGITRPMPAVATNAQAQSISPKLFQVMLLQAMPPPAAPQTFQTLLTQAASPASNVALPDAERDEGMPSSAGAATIGVSLLAPLGAPTMALPQVPPGDNGPLFVRPPADGLNTVQVAAVPIGADPPDSEPAPLTNTQLDPLQSAALQHELPGLATALNEQAMRAHLQAALFGAAPSRYTVARCIPGKATYSDSEGCRLQYQLEVKDATSGQSFLPLVNGRVFAHQQQCSEYFRERLAPLAELTRGRDELAPFLAPVAALEALAMTVAVFPIDGDMPALATATDRESVSAILSETLPELHEGGFSLDNLRIDLAQYARRGRCVLRYTLYGHQPGVALPWHQVIYGKLSADGSGATVGALSTALQQQAQHKPRAFQFALPHARGYRPDLHLVLLEALPGVPQLGQLLKMRLRGIDDDEEEGLALEDALTVAASIASTLHSAGIVFGPRRTLEHELATLHAEIGALLRLAPELGARLQRWLWRIEAYAEESDPLPYCLNHGNFKYTKLIFDGSDVGLVDLDGFCQAEPALDLGHFQAYLRIVAQKTQPMASFAPSAITDQLCAHFLAGYSAAAGDALLDAERLRVRVSIYEALILLGAVVHSWQILKTSRIAHVLAVLEERMAALPVLSY